MQQCDYTYHINKNSNKCIYLKTNLITLEKGGKNMKTIL